MTLGDFVPPIVNSAVRKWIAREAPRKGNQPVLQKLFASYDEAMAACENFGYEAADLVEIVFRKTQAYRLTLQDRPPAISPGDALLLSALGADRSRPLHVLDFGGACGAHYYGLNALFRNNLKVAWHVVETTAMAARCKQAETESLRFFASVDEALRAFNGRVDVIFSSGALQCVPDMRATLRRLLDCKGQLLVLSRLALVESKENVICIHESKLGSNGPGPIPEGLPDGITKHPFIFSPRQSVENLIGEKYDITLAATDPSGIFPINGLPVTGMGYVATLRR